MSGCGGEGVDSKKNKDLRPQIHELRQLVRQERSRDHRFDKSPSESARLKLLGNEALKAQRLQHALRFYDQVSQHVSMCASVCRRVFLVKRAAYM